VSQSAAGAPVSGDNAIWCNINTSAAFVSTETCTYTTINSNGSLGNSTTTLTTTDTGSNATDLLFNLSLVYSALTSEWNSTSNSTSNMTLFFYDSDTSFNGTINNTAWTFGTAG
jgi:hypothetical protein